MRPTHLQKELVKLRATKEYLKENFVINEDDLGYLELGNNEEE